MMTIAIDPGLSGGIAWADEDPVRFSIVPGSVGAVKMPGTPKDTLEFFMELRGTHVLVNCFMENVGGSRPGNAAMVVRIKNAGQST